jgi:hypothetical protein
VKLTPLAVLALTLLCATLLTAMGKIPVDTVDKILLLIVGGALGSLGPQNATTAANAALGLRIASGTLPIAPGVSVSNPPPPPEGGK